ncbi:phosphatase PAP2 family protein [Trebonia sp.]|uniref:phosphatase PAP2 family protein n=1 Tax=Trebonia sp. TaxID=2767075 RepID=UPI00262EE334|nr:phosphatase PAP2 family protein [Trebonia sp.]
MPQTRAAKQLAAALRELGDVDRAIYHAVAATPTPDLDGPVRWLSHAADRSRIWLAIAAALAVFGGPAGRRAAARGILTVAVTSAAVNLGVKSVYPRRRPDRAGAGVPPGRQVPMPSSRSFPSGHSASGFAFAASVGRDLPALALPLRLLAGAVAYSRVHTGVHYPGDALFGSIVGAGVAEVVAAPAGRVLARAGLLPDPLGEVHDTGQHQQPGGGRRLDALAQRPVIQVDAGRQPVLVRRQHDGDLAVGHPAGQRAVARDGHAAGEHLADDARGRLLQACPERCRAGIGCAPTWPAPCEGR